MQQRIPTLQKQIKLLEKKVKKYPSGLLVCYKINNHSKWYCQETDSSGKITRKYIPKSNKQFAQKLAQKNYYSTLLKEKKSELDCINRYLKDIRSIKSSSMLNPSSNFFELLNDLSPISSWEKESYIKNPDHPEACIFKTKKGDYVRSKSEAYIADTLYENNIPYRYECRMKIGDISLHPDFTIMHPITGNIYIWEHFGLMNRKSYVSSSFDKIPLYQSASFMPGHNMIITYESTEMPLDYEQVIAIINFYFLNKD